MKESVFSIEVCEQNIKDFVEYLQERESAKATVQKYVTDIKTLFSFLGDSLVIDKIRLMQYKEWLIKKYAVSSVNSILAALNQFLAFLDAECLKVKRLKIQNQTFLKQDKELTKAEYQKLVRTALNEGKEQLALCMETIALTGIRISELEFFTVERIKKGNVEVYNKGKYRRIFVPSLLQKKLLRYCKKQHIVSGWIFITRNGKPKNRSNIWSEMKALKKKSGIDGSKIFPHNFRHLFARIYYQRTKDVNGLAELLGHSSLNVTRIYTANTETYYQNQLDKLVRERVLELTT